jgi:hypothetical protein
MSNRIGEFVDLKDCEKGKNFLVLGAGATVKHYRDRISAIIERESLIVIGINNITHICYPDYHLWTNNDRLKKFGGCIKSDSTVILGGKIKTDNIPNHVKYYSVIYVDNAFYSIFMPPNFSNGKIHGSFRCAGNLALYMANLMGAKKIYYAGVDGYSNPFNGDQHCYGKGFTDTDDMEYAKKKDEILNKCLYEIKKVVDFSVITPTIHEEFYDETILATD